MPGAPGSRFFAGTDRVCGFAQTDLIHTARFRDSTKLLYPYHPLFGDAATPLEIIGARSDMFVARLPDNSRRGIPAWMFDVEVCASVRELPHPVIHSAALLEIMDMLECSGLGARNTPNEHKSQLQECCDPRITTNSGKPSLNEARSRKPNRRGKEKGVHRADPPTDRSRRPHYHRRKT